MTKVSSFLWIVATFFLIYSGIYYTFKLNFRQFDFKNIFISLKNNNKGISSLKILSLSLAGRIGVGSLSGIALGIYKGGYGVLFWVWLSCLITLPNTYVESFLAHKFHIFDGKKYKGGPCYYISNGLGLKRLAKIYAIVFSLCYLFGFLGIQANTMATNLFYSLNIPLYVTGILVAIFSFAIIFKGFKSIIDFTSRFVPIMGIVYLFVIIYVIIVNIKLLPGIFFSIVKCAFDIKSMGWGIVTSIIIGVQKGIFASESGLGTGAIASSSSDDVSSTKAGYLQMLGVYFTTFIICGGTAIIILTSKVNFNFFVNPNGIEITSMAFQYHLGSLGKIILLFCVLAFSFSTIVSGYYYGESNIEYLFGKMNSKNIFLLKILIVIILFLASCSKPFILWNLVDVGVSLLAIINSICLILFRRKEFIYDRE